MYGVAIPTVRGVRNVLDAVGAAKGEFREAGGWAQQLGYAAAWRLHSVAAAQRWKGASAALFRMWMQQCSHPVVRVAAAQRWKGARAALLQMWMESPCSEGGGCAAVGTSVGEKWQQPKLSWSKERCAAVGEDSSNWDTARKDAQHWGVVAARRSSVVGAKRCLGDDRRRV